MRNTEFFYKDINAPKPNKPNHIGTAIILLYEGKILLEHRADSETWSLIGGGLKTDETLVQGVIREVLEETGIELAEEKIEFYKMYDDPSRIAKYPDGNVLRIISVVYKAELEKLPVLICSHESRELRFFSIDEIKTINIAKTHIPIINNWA